MLEYELLRSKRKTVGISIKDGKITVKAPKYVNKRDIDSFVEKNREWIEKKLALGLRKRSRFADFLDCKKFLYMGKVLDIKAAKNKRVLIDGGAIYIPSEIGVSDLKTKLVKEYKRLAVDYLQARLDVLSEYSGMKYEKLVLTSAKSKWGSCSSERLMRLNWRLMMLPEGLSDYVLIHELCHTKHMNHSSEFWNCVAEFIPDYKKRRQLLKEYSAIMDVLR